MELSVATRLIEQGVDKTIQQQTWADLGAGSGLFTKAISSLIESGTIYAIDKNTNDLSISTKPSVKVQKVKADFTAKNLNIELCDGILLANSLHYVSDKNTFVRKLKHYLKATGVLIIVEYERNTSNPWVPYPILFRDLEKLMLQESFAILEKIGETPSVFDKSMIYSAVIRQS